MQNLTFTALSRDHVLPAGERATIILCRIIFYKLPPKNIHKRMYPENVLNLYVSKYPQIPCLNDFKQLK